ncbi:MAG: ZIP family metal transporter [Candidatus Micrarchaeota archaeon]|nr:ZIP family metal transporter [Candidatus Micrarchaeota archaeon]
MEIPPVFFGALLAFLATSAGAACLAFAGKLGRQEHAALLSFSSGVMLFASIEMLESSYSSSGMQETLMGLAAGMAAMLLLERAIPHAHAALKKQGIGRHEKKALMIAGAITLHNIPEGFAIASSFASSSQLGWLVSLSIAAQDFPEGLVVSAPLIAYGVRKKDSILWGSFSGAVEAAAAALGYAALSAVSAIAPLALSFSAGAMVFVTLFELLPDAFAHGKPRDAVAWVAAGLILAYAIVGLLS